MAKKAEFQYSAFFNYQNSNYNLEGLPFITPSYALHSKGFGGLTFYYPLLHPPLRGGPGPEGPDTEVPEELQYYSSSFCFASNSLMSLSWTSVGTSS